MKWLIALAALASSAHADDHAVVQKAIDQAHASHDWKPAVPVLAKQLTVDDFAIDAAFDAIVALGPNDPSVTVALLAPITHMDWNAPTVKIPFARVDKAEKRVHQAAMPAYIALAKQPDTPANRDVRLSVLEHLAYYEHVPELRPIWVAMLKEPPLLEGRAKRPPDPRSLTHATALAGLQSLGFDDASAKIFFDYAWSTDDKVTYPDDRSLYREIPFVAKTLTAAQKAKLLADATDRNHPSDGAGTLYALYATTDAELDKLTKAPPENPPYFFGFTETIKFVRRVLACHGDRPCLIALLETAVDRQYDNFLLERVRLDLARDGADDARPAVLATFDELRASSFRDSDVDVLEKLWTTGCVPCKQRTDADKRIRNAFTAPLSYLHVGHWTGSYDPDIFTRDAFVIGREATDVGTPIADTAKRNIAVLGAYDGNVTTHRGVHGRVMWNLEEPIHKPHGLQAVGELVVEDHGEYRIRAMMIADSISDQDAARSPAPAAIADNHGDKELEQFTMSVLSSRKRFITALSNRPDSIAHGNYLGDEWPAGAGKTAFAKLGGDFKIHDGIHVERVADDAGFAFANVDYLKHTYRVFLVVVKDNGAWTIPLAQWSLASLSNN
ncbi:MAG: hypothetical protein QM831_06780 [Kofleriaceae bacterium]